MHLPSMQFLGFAVFVLLRQYCHHDELSIFLVREVTWQKDIIDLFTIDRIYKKINYNVNSMFISRNRPLFNKYLLILLYKIINHFFLSFNSTTIMWTFHFTVNVVYTVDYRGKNIDFKNKSFLRKVLLRYPENKILHGPKK